MIRVLRTLTVSGVLCVVVLTGYHRLKVGSQNAVIAELQAMQAEMEARLAERAEMIARLARTRRLARLSIVAQRRGTDGVVDDTDVLFVELDDEGTELARQMFTIPGDVLFIDAWTVKFAAEHVAIGHPLFGRTLVLLRRIYSDQMPPARGFPIDTPGAVPPGYAASDVGRYEQRIWEHFWEIATDATLAREMGVRVAQGEAVYKAVAEGQMFDLIVDAIGGISLTPVDGADALSLGS